MEQVGEGEGEQAGAEERVGGEVEGSRDVRPESMGETMEGSTSGLTLKRTTCSTVGGAAVDIVEAVREWGLMGRESEAGGVGWGGVDWLDK